MNLYFQIGLKSELDWLLLTTDLQVPFMPVFDIVMLKQLKAINTAGQILLKQNRWLLLAVSQFDGECNPTSCLLQQALVMLLLF